MAKGGNTLAKIGVWTFIIGVVLALLASFFTVSDRIVVPVLVLAGLIVGLLNVTDKETTSFLIAAVAIMVALYTAGSQVGNMTTLGTIGGIFVRLLANINVFVFPATIIVALKAIYSLSKEA